MVAKMLSMRAFQISMTTIRLTVLSASRVVVILWVLTRALQRLLVIVKLKVLIMSEVVAAFWDKNEDISVFGNHQETNGPHQ